MEGAWVAARIFDRQSPARHVVAGARSLLAAHDGMQTADDGASGGEAR
jgi:hypothetical protein